MISTRAASFALRWTASVLLMGLGLVLAHPTLAARAIPGAAPSLVGSASDDTTVFSNPRAADPTTPDYLLWPHPGAPGAAPLRSVEEDALQSTDGNWSQIKFEEGITSPHRRVYSSAIYDPVRKRMIVFGGLFNTIRYNDVWTLSLTGPALWQQMSPSGTPPSPRYASTAVYDPVRDLILFFGGNDLVGNRNDVWALSLSGGGSWSQVLTFGVPPSPRIVNSAIFDPLRDRMLIFAGHDGSFKNDLWALNLSTGPTWTLLTPAGSPPSPRDGAPAIYDPVRDRMVVFGGWNGSLFLNDTWSLSLAATETWSAVPADGTLPAARREGVAIYDPVRDRMLISGGFGGADGFNDVWALSFPGTPAWTNLAPSGPAPTRRWGQAAIYDPLADRMDIFAGVDFIDWRNDVYGVSLGGSPAWMLVSASSNTAPLPRDLHLSVYDGFMDRMVVFGGEGPWILGDVWQMSFSGPLGWFEMYPTGTGPGPRYACAGVYDPEGQRLVVFGGYDGRFFHNDVWSLSLGATPAWTQLSPDGTGPGPRGTLTASYDSNRGRMILFGGSVLGAPLNDTWALSLRGTPTWTQILPVGGPPPPRAGCAQIYDPVRDQLVITGGTTDGTMGYDDAWALSLSGTPEWHQWTPSGTGPTARWDHPAIYDQPRDRLLFFGGVDLVDWRNDVWSLSLGASPAWQQLFTDGGPPRRRVAHSDIYDPLRDRMLTFGGRYDYLVLNDTWQLSLTAPTPTLISLASADATRDGVALSWYVADGAGLEVTLERSTDGAAWAALTTRHPDGDGLVRFDDRDVVAGGRYGYRLSFVERGAAKQSTEVWLDIPKAALFSLAGSRPNPSAGVFTVSFSIPDASASSLELLDMAGRRLETLEVGSLGAGSHVVRLGAGRRLEPGVYWLRLRRGGQSLSSRVALVR